MNELLGDQPASLFLVLHERERWVLPAQLLALACWGPVVLWGESLRGVAPSVIVGVVVLLAFVRRPWILARSGSSVLLVESPRFFANASRVVSVMQAPLVNAADCSLVTTRFSLFGRRFETSAIHKEQLIGILS